MGYPGKNHKSYQTPKRPFEKTRIEEQTGGYRVWSA